MSGTWDFAPNGMVVTNAPPSDSSKTMDMNGWNFSAKPNQPYQLSFMVKLHGMTWYTAVGGLYDITTAPTVNARRFELFAQAQGTHSSFTFPHPHLGSLTCRFKSLPSLGPGIPNSNGLMESFEVELVHHNPSYS